MANDISRRPWLLDSPGLVKAGLTHMTGVVFRDYTGGAASRLTLQDSRGKNIINLPGVAAGTPVGEQWFTDIEVKDLTVTAIDSGIAEVIVK